MFYPLYIYTTTSYLNIVISVDVIMLLITHHNMKQSGFLHIQLGLIITTGFCVLLLLFLTFHYVCLPFSYSLFSLRHRTHSFLFIHCLFCFLIIVSIPTGPFLPYNVAYVSIKSSSVLVVCDVPPFFSSSCRKSSAHISM